MTRTSVRGWGVAAGAIVLACALIGWLLYGGPLRPRHRAPGGAPSATSVGSGTSTTARLAWEDDFNGPAGSPPNRANWHIITGGGGWGNDELQYYTASSSNIALDGAGHLAITARRERHTDARGVSEDYTSSLIQTLGRFQTTYGRIEARIRLPAGRGLWPAFWAMGADFDRVGWPDAGEIDLMENKGGDPFTFYAVLHGPWRGHRYGYNLVGAQLSASSLAAGFHVFGIDWSPGKLVYTFDGVPYLTRTPASLPAHAGWVFDRPFYLILDLAVGGNFTGRPDSSTPFPATMLIDWVRAYSS